MRRSVFDLLKLGASTAQALSEASSSVGPSFARAYAQAAKAKPSEASRLIQVMCQGGSEGRISSRNPGEGRSNRGRGEGEGGCGKLPEGLLPSRFDWLSWRNAACFHFS